MTHSRWALGFWLIPAFVLLPVLAQSDPRHTAWPPNSDALVESWHAHHDDLNALRDMVVEGKFAAVVLFGDYVDVRADDHSQVVLDKPDADLFASLMKTSNISAIGHVGEMIGFVITPPKTENDRSESINYLHRDPVQAKPCTDKFRDVFCGICDVPLDDEWSIRYTWSSGEFEKEYSNNFKKVFQDTDAKLSIDEVRSRYDESKRACMKTSLEEMGYENPQDFYSIDR